MAGLGPSAAPVFERCAIADLLRGEGFGIDSTGAPAMFSAPVGSWGSIRDLFELGRRARALLEEVTA